jgi:competence ComEA-like helix-hairpin-helix protein
MRRLHAVALWMCTAAWLALTTPAHADPRGGTVAAPRMANEPAHQAPSDDRPACRPLTGAPDDTPDARAKTVDLNTADESALLDLPGIGPARARAILEYRVAHGGFQNVSQLLHIRGIGRALLKQLRPLVTLTPNGR